MVKVSILMPVYNLENYIEHAMESIFKQTLKDIEIICVNDGSVDGSLEVLREFESKYNFIKIDFQLLDFLEEISLGMFLTMALMSVDLLKLSDIFGPIILIVIFQVIFIVLYSIFVCFKVLGRDFDSAVIISGLIGHGLGATPNALANMNSVSQKYGLSEKAFLVVPLVGAFLLDIFTMPCIILFINLLS